MKSELLKRLMQSFVCGLGLGTALVAAYAVFVVISMLCWPISSEQVDSRLLEVHGAVVDTANGAWRVRFQVRNGSENHVTQFVANVDLLDSSGQFVGEVEKWYRGTLPPGETDGMVVTAADYKQFEQEDFVPTAVADCRVRIGHAFSQKGKIQ